MIANWNRIGALGVGVVCCLGMGAAAGGQTPTPVGERFIVNTHTAGEQEEPDIAIGSHGDFLVVWTDLTGLDGSESGVFARMFANDASPLGDQFQVNTYAASGQAEPAVAANREGDFVVVWATGKPKEFTGVVLGEVMGQMFANDGTRLGGEFPISEPSAALKNTPCVDISESGEVVVAWTESVGNEAAIVARRLASDGTSLGAPFRVSTRALNTYAECSVAVDEDGDFVVAWDEPARVVSRAFLRTYSSEGEEVSQEVELGTSHLDNVYPNVDMESDGNFVMAWLNRDDLSLSIRVSAQKFADDGRPLTDEFALGDLAGDRSRPAIALDDDGNAVIVWNNNREGGGIFGQRVAANGTLRGDVFTVSADPDRFDQIPAVASSTNGNFVVAWRQFDRQRSSERFDIVGHRFAVDESIDDTPRISYWWGKVNQHTEDGIWKTDPDGRSGANLDKLAYCRKWYPETARVEPYEVETITDWKRAGNRGSYTRTSMSDRCVPPERP